MSITNPLLHAEEDVVDVDVDDDDILMPLSMMFDVSSSNVGLSIDDILNLLQTTIHSTKARLNTFWLDRRSASKRKLIKFNLPQVHTASDRNFRILGHRALTLV